MKKLSSLSVIFVFLLIISNGIQGQTTQTPPDQLKMMQQCFGVWHADYAKDTIEVWDWKPYGKASIVTVTLITKGKEIPFYVNNISFNSKEGKFYGFVLWPNGGRMTWISSFVSETKFSGALCTDFDPEKTWRTIEIIFENPNVYSFHEFNVNGVIYEDLKFNKVK
ncbi:MAG: hypothetical protein NT092_13050 [Bacteroidia bacterium]|nr:hypothetical protein [Bacteroidia bacterium]